MKNNVLKHFFTIGIGTLFNMILGLLTTPIITRIVSPEEYGKFSMFTLYSNMAVMVLCLGLDQALVRYYYEQKDIEHKKNLLLKCIIFPIIISILVIVLIVINSIYRIFPIEFGIDIVVILCSYTLIQIIYRFSLLIIRLEFKLKLFSTLNVLLKILYICILLPLILIFKNNYLISLCLAITISTLLCMSISIVAQRNIWNIFCKNVKNNAPSIKELLKYSYPFIFSMGITTLFQAIDKISISHYLDYSQVGIYASAMSLVNIFAIVQTTFNTTWAPMAMKHYTELPQDTNFYKEGNKGITIIMFFLGISLILCKDIFVMLLGEKYREAAMLLPLLIFNPIMSTISESTVNGLVFKKKSNMQVLVAVGACLANIVGNVFLVPILGCRGAAISTGISYILFFSLRTILSNKYYYVDFELKKFYFLTVVVFIFSLYNMFHSFNILILIGYLICFVLIYMLYKNTIIKYLKMLVNKIKERKVIKNEN